MSNTHEILEALLSNERSKAFTNAASSKSVLIVGSAFVDVVANIESFPTPGSDTNAHYQSTVVGGCSFNVADVLYKLNLPFDSFMPLGEGNMSKIILEEFQKRSYPLSFIKGRGDNGWCLSLVEKNAERTFITFQGIETRLLPSDLKVYNLSNYDYIYLSGYQLDRTTANHDFVLTLLASLPLTANLVFDPGPRIGEIDKDIMDAINAHHPIYTINAEEARYLAKCEDLNEAARSIFELTQNHVVITDGARGAYIIDAAKQQASKKSAMPDSQDCDASAGTCTGAGAGAGNGAGAWAGSGSGAGGDAGAYACEVMVVPSFKVKAVDTIGAGDSHTGGVIAGLMCGLKLYDAVLLGNRIASFVSSQHGGACAPTLDELKVLFSEELCYGE